MAWILALALAALAATVWLLSVVIPPVLSTLTGVGHSMVHWLQPAPGVTVGRDAFERVTVTDRGPWRLAGEFDGEPGEELAIGDYQAIRLLTPPTFTERRRLPLDLDVAANWNASTALAWVGGGLVVVDTGGGVEETRVRDLDGTERWRYRPGLLPTRSLIAADGDGDGDGGVKFYAAIASDVVRLDPAGRELWRAPFAGGTIVATAPRTARDPGWIVASSGERGGVWDDRGRSLASLVLKDAQPLGVIDWPSGRFLLAGGPALRALGLDGTVAFEWSVAGLRVTEALPVSLTAGAPAALALVAEALGATNHWQIQLVSFEKRLLYDERTATPPRLLRTRGADGVDRLFVNSASLLDALRPISR